MGDFFSSDESFVRMYRLLAPRLLRFFARRTLDQQVAVDLVAETFAQALASKRKFRGTTDDEASGWIFAIARGLLASYYKSGVARNTLSRRLVGGLPDLAPDDYARIDELASLSELRGLLREQIALLDDGQRDALWLRIIEEKPFSDVAEELGITDAAARKRVSRALKILAEVSGKLEASLGGMPYDHA